MATVLNGCLIVLLTILLGLEWNDKLLIGAAFAMAGAAYIVNVLDDWNVEGKLREVLFLATVILGAATYAYVAYKLIGA